MSDGTPEPAAFRIPTIDELDAMRVSRGLSQKQLSREAGMEPDRFNTILHRDMDPQTSTTRAFLDVLQETAPKHPDTVERRGPKPRRSTLSDGGEEVEAEAEEAARDECVGCGEDVLVDGDIASIRYGDVMCRDCASDPIAYEATCDNVLCDWSARSEGRRFNHGDIKKNAQMNANNHETEKRVFDDDPMHNTTVERVET